MSAEILQYVSIGLFIAAAIFLLVSVALFFGLNIPAVIGELSGRRAKREIEDIRNKNEKTSSTPNNKNGGHITRKIAADGQTDNEAYVPANFATQKIATNRLKEEAATTVLNDATTVLNTPGYGETTVLDNSDVGGTTVLTPDMSMTNAYSGNDEITVIAEFAFAQSTEII